MKSIRILVAAVALCVMASGPELQARNPKNDKKIAKIDTVVGGLTYYQTTQIDSILTTAQSQLDALLPSERRAKGVIVRQASMAAVRAQLNFSQRKKFDAMTPGP